MPDRLDRALALLDENRAAHQKHGERLARIEERLGDLPGLREEVAKNEDRIADLEKAHEATKTKVTLLGAGAASGGIGLLAWLKHWLGIGGS